MSIVVTGDSLEEPLKKIAGKSFNKAALSSSLLQKASSDSLLSKSKNLGVSGSFLTLWAGAGRILAGCWTSWLGPGWDLAGPGGFLAGWGTSWLGPGWVLAV